MRKHAYRAKCTLCNHADTAASKEDALIASIRHIASVHAIPVPKIRMRDKTIAEDKL